VSNSIFTNRVFVTTESSARANAIAKSLANSSANKYRIVSVYDQFLIIHLPNFKSSDLLRIKKLPGVISAQRTFRTRYQSTETKQCDCQASTPELQLPFIHDELECIAMSNCSKGAKNRLWAQKFLGTDLAQAYLRSKNIVRSTQIGIVDSGFDLSAIDQIEVPEKFIVLPALPNAKLESDPIGHGSRVASMIKGKNGLGGSVDSPVSVYSLAKGHAIDNAEVGIGILRSCESGNNIINVSIGIDFGPIKTTLSDLLPKELNDRLKQKGCILVHSSGNASASFDLNSGSEFEFEIGSLDSDENISSFTSPSQFNAPGENVIGMLSAAEKGIDKNSLCGPDRTSKQSFSSGTSFAAPLLTATMAMIRDVLLRSDVFRNMSHSHQATHLRKILKASEVGKTPNAYMAVQIAETWTQQPHDTIELATERLKSSSSKNCGPEFRPACGGVSCVEQDKCDFHARSYAYLCGSVDQTAIPSLIQQLQKRGDLENASYWLRRFANFFPSQKLSLEFPTEQMKVALNSNSSQPLTLRWLKYFNLWRHTHSHSTSINDPSTTQIYLEKATKSALNNITELDGREHSLNAFNEVASLFLESRRLNSNSQNSAVDWMKEMSKDPTKVEFAIVAVLRGRMAGVVPKSEISQIATDLVTGISSNTNSKDQKDISRAILFIDGSGLPDAQKVAYASTILKNSNLNDENLSKVINLTSTTDTNNYLNVLDAAVRHPGLGNKSSVAIAWYIQFLMAELPPEHRHQGIQLLNLLKLQPGASDAAKEVIRLGLEKQYPAHSN
jgi:hypothetical protein